jgi:hypothetical protein
MNTPSLSTVGTQAELEARATRLGGVDLDASSDLKAVFGGATEWVMDLGPFRFFLIPFLGEWWFFDEAHGEWRFTGKKIGEARFIFENDVLRILDAGAAAAAAPQASAPPLPLSDQQPAPSAASVPRFCSACGAPAQPDRNFCLKCGAKLLGHA